jgi:pentatricopeptide repeat protein
LEEKTIVSWNSIISGLTSQKQSENALRYFSHMLQVGVIPGNYTYVLLKLTLLKINVLNSMFNNIGEKSHINGFILFLTHRTMSRGLYLPRLNSHIAPPYTNCFICLIQMNPQQEN